MGTKELLVPHGQQSKMADFPLLSLWDNTIVLTLIYTIRDFHITTIMFLMAQKGNQLTFNINSSCFY